MTSPSSLEASPSSALSVMMPPSPMIVGLVVLPPTALMAAVVILPLAALIVTSPASLSRESIALLNPSVTMSPSRVTLVAAVMEMSPESSPARFPVVVIIPAAVLFITSPSMMTLPPCVLVAPENVTVLSSMRSASRMIMSASKFASSPWTSMDLAPNKGSLIVKEFVGLVKSVTSNIPSIREIPFAGTPSSLSSTVASSPAGRLMTRSAAVPPSASGSISLNATLPRPTNSTLPDSSPVWSTMTSATRSLVSSV